MEIRDVKSIRPKAAADGTGASVKALYPVAPVAQGLIALDYWEIQTGGATALHRHAEEHVVYVLSGSGELVGESPGGPSARLGPESVAYVGPNEAHSLRNTGKEPFRLLVSTPLVVRSDRLLGVQPSEDVATEVSPEVATPVAKPIATAPEAEEVREEPKPDISGLMRKASELVGAPRSERKKPPPTEPGPPAGESVSAEEEQEAEGPSSLMELFVAFDGGSRGNPGQGYGSYLVQSPGRRPVVKRVEFGDNYTNNQAEYDTLITALQYIVERLRATNRTPKQMQLDIRSDSDLVVNQLLGNFKVKDAGMKPRHAEALQLLDQFADWRIEWHSREENVRLLGH